MGCWIKLILSTSYGENIFEILSVPAPNACHFYTEVDQQHIEEDWHLLYKKELAGFKKVLPSGNQFHFQMDIYVMPISDPKHQQGSPRLTKEDFGTNSASRKEEWGK